MSCVFVAVPSIKFIWLSSNLFFFEAKCSADQFTCQDGTCIAGSKRCDTVAACPDKSDERDCGELSFLTN